MNGMQNKLYDEIKIIYYLLIVTRHNEQINRKKRL